MGRPPAYIFIVRHGNRLDAADKLWHLSSPTPYDPPLTYGGWTQSKTIGQRIGNILRDSDPAEIHSTPNSPVIHSIPGSPVSPARPTTPGDVPPPAKKRRYNVVVHSSPFLRCIQTSIAIAAGLASDPRPLEAPPRSSEPLSPLPEQSVIQNASALSSDGGHPTEAANKIKKTVMRLDAFLGEWLSPGYFELITPPPSSHLMVASAKAELLRREDYSSFTYTPGHTYSHSTSQLWGGGAPLSHWSARLDENEDRPTSNPRPLTPTIQHLTADGLSSPKNGDLPSPRWLGTRGRAGNGMRPIPGGYVAPVPQFALSSKSQAPVDYVAHARDACVELDYQWDSMRAPLDWGDGGEFGEEWTAMHRRFRKGLQHLVDWYTVNDDPTEPVTKLVHFKAPSSGGRRSMECAIEDDNMTVDDDDDDYIEESVVILVSHGAGCNALIGAITQHPVLMDVGLSSLTAAARKPGMESAPKLVNRPAGKSSKGGRSPMGTDLLHNPNGVVPLNQYYEMKLFASTDHLRSSNSSPSASRSSSIAGVLGGTRARHSNSLSSALTNVGFGENGFAAHRSTSAGSSYGTGRRPSGTATRPSWMSNITTSPRSGGGGGGGITVGSGVTSFSSGTTSSPLGRSSRPSIGLWSPLSARSFDDDGRADDDMEILLSFGPESVSEKEEVKTDEKKEQPTLSSPATTLVNGQNGKSAASQNGGNNRDHKPAGDSRPDSSASSKTSFSLLSPAAMGGLWSTQPRSPVELEAVHDMTSAKRRWSVNDRA